MEETLKTKKEANPQKMEIIGSFSKAQLISFPSIGEVIEGKLIEKNAKTLFFDLGTVGVGTISGKEYQRAGQDIKELKIGDSIFSKIINLENEDGYVELSLKEAGRDMNWARLQEKLESKELIEAKVSEANRGGLIAKIFEVPAFLPVSQLSAAHYPRIKDGDKEKILEELRKFIGQTLQVQIIDLNPSEEKLIISEKAETQKKIKEIISKYQVGDVVEGEIGGIVDFGAFIKFPMDVPEEEKIEGLIHISELDYKLVKSPQDIVKVGETVKAKIIDINSDRVSLSLKALKDDPWKLIGEKYKKGDEIMGQVIKFNPFGAFVELPDGLQGLLHVSEFGSEKKMKELIDIKKEYKFKIILIDPEDHKIALGLQNEAE